jgi:signal transduction histidine kinase
VTGLRFRAILAFGLGALLLSSTVGVLTYLFAERYLVGQREASLQREAFVHARLVREEALRSQRPAQTLESLERAPDSTILVASTGEWIASSVGIGPDDLPRALRRAAREGVVAHQRFELRGQPSYAIGIPIPAVSSVYFEVFDLDELERSLGILRASLLGAAAIATLLGALVGLWASRRVLRPVADVALAAEMVGSGNLHTRLEPINDRDLDRVITSFNGMVDVLEQRIERDERFVSDVSHELRSPLTTLSAAADVMQAQRTELSTRGQLAFDLLAEEVERFGRTLEDLLQLSLSGTEAEPVQLTPVELGTLVDRAVAAAGTHVCVMVDSTAAAPTLVDERRMERAVANLVDNARRHAGGVVAASVRLRGDQLQIVIDDAGPGVPTAERDRIFERFARGAATRRDRSSSGGGLGLALVQEDVRLHGGRVWVEDAPGSTGARFVIEVPWRPA